MTPDIVLQSHRPTERLKVFGFTSYPIESLSFIGTLLKSLGVRFFLLSLTRVYLDQLSFDGYHIHQLKHVDLNLESYPCRLRFFPDWSTFSGVRNV